MNAYANPAHEERRRNFCARAAAACSSRRTELSREWYEYERTSTVAVNAYVGPQVNRYVRQLERACARRVLRLALHDGSNGGMLSVERRCRRPFALVESGPVAAASARGG